MEVETEPNMDKDTEANMDKDTVWVMEVFLALGMAVQNMDNCIMRILLVKTMILLQEILLQSLSWVEGFPLLHTTTENCLVKFGGKLQPYVKLHVGSNNATAVCNPLGGVFHFGRLTLKVCYSELARISR